MIARFLLPFLAAITLPAASAATATGDDVPPDFTAGGRIPEKADHTWNLGATGMRGWMFSRRMSTSEARQILVTDVAPASPAETMILKGDVILGVAGKRFASDPRTEFGMALTEAESEEGNGKLTLTVWRAGKISEITLHLKVLGRYSATAPFDCPKSKQILESGCMALAARMTAAGYDRTQNPITRSFNALALLASGNPVYLPLVRKEVEWASGFQATSNQPWWFAGPMMLIAEYTTFTADKTYLPGLRRLALDTAKGASIVGSWGHNYAGTDGRLIGYGMMNSTGVPLTIALVMARDAGVDDPEVETVIRRSADLLRFYTGKGAVPYGDHAPWILTHEDNGKCGKAAVLFHLLGEAQPAEFFSRMALASHGNERDTGHTGNFFNMTWAIPAISLGGANATGSWMKEFGAWYFDLARSWDASFVHLGPPQTKKDSYATWDCTGTYLLAYAMPLRQIRLTGKSPSLVPQLDAAAAEAIVNDGRGWTEIDRYSAYDSLTPDTLLAKLGSWSPIVRHRAALALARRGGMEVAPFLKMLEEGNPEQKLGACEALTALKADAAPAVPMLMKTLRNEELWLRIKAAEALAAIGEPAAAAIPELLTMVAQGPTESDPRNMQQRYLCYALFGKFLREALPAVDRDLLRQAIAAGLGNQDGRARSAVGEIYQQLSFEDIRPLLPAIHEAIVKPAPSGIMFASGIRVAGLEVFAKHRIREGLPLAFTVMDIDAWGKKDRIKRCLKVIESYGPAAREVLPQLRQLEKDLAQHKEAKMLAPLATTSRELIDRLEKTQQTGELRSLQDL
ncbi:MAG: DUF6288 domain-containing protein [Akkermansiaceae bacterium]|jgi:hypothetical protein|nr:DUF6288 domain-containing protein [Akkermansiaceae bacterium]